MVQLTCFSKKNEKDGINSLNWGHSLGSPKRIIDFLQMAVIANNLVNQKEDRQSRGNERLLLWKYNIVVDTEG